LNRRFEQSGLWKCDVSYYTGTIDDPLDALASQIESEERSRSRPRKSLDDLVGPLPGWLGKVLSWGVQRDRAAKQRLTIDVTKAEVRRHETRGAV
jgi:hypothetical protein